MNDTLWLDGILIWVLLSVAVGYYNQSRGHSFLAGFAFSILLSPLVAFIIIAVRAPDTVALERQAIAVGFMKKCPSCAELIKKEALKCRYCGNEKFEISIKVPRTPGTCQTCGKKTNVENAKFCIACGSLFPGKHSAATIDGRIDRVVSPKASSTSPQTEQRRILPNEKKAFIVFFGLIILAIALHQWLLSGGGAVRRSEQVDYSNDSMGFIACARDNDTSAAKRFLDGGMSPDSTNENGDTPLHGAAAKNSKEVAELLIAYGADVNKMNSAQQTPLILAALEGSLGVAEILLLKGASIDAKDEEGNTPFIITVRKRQVGFAEMLASKGADVNAMVEGKRTLLSEAVANGDSILVEWLISLKADVNAKNESGEAPLHIVLSKGQYGFGFSSEDEKIFSMLISAGADVNVKEKTGGKTPLMLAIDDNHEKEVKVLIAKGANIYIKDDSGKSALARTSDSEVINHLLKSKKVKQVKKVDEEICILEYKGEVNNLFGDIISIKGSEGSGSTNFNITSRTKYIPTSYRPMGGDIVTISVDSKNGFITIKKER